MNATSLVLLTALTSVPTAGRVLEKQTACKPAPKTELVRLDFDGAPVHDLVREVGRLLCRNFVLDPHIATMPIYVVSAAETRVDALWLAFLHILRVNQLTVVDHGDYQSIVMAADATRESVPNYGPADAVPPEERMVTKIVEVKGRDLDETVNFLNIFKSDKGQIHPNPSAGMVVMTDYASSIGRLEWLLGQTARNGGR